MKAKNFINAGLIIATTALSLGAYAETVVDQVDVGSTVKDTGKSIATVASDTGLTTKIKAKLALEADIPLNISITTTDGIVHVSGVVETNLQANKIIDLITSVEGVKDVDDSQLHVTSSDLYLHDASITAKVKYKIMELIDQQKIGAANLHVETTNGNVHIFGTVAKKADIATIKNSLSDIEGIKNIKTNIDVAKN